MRLLIADDEPIVCTIFSHHLKQYASPYIEYEIVHDGEQLIKKCESMHPDLIITDINMPKLSGLEAIEEIRKSYSDSMSVYILSGFTDFELVRSALLLGVSDYIPKPIRYSQMEQLLNTEEKKRFLGLSLDDAYKLGNEDVALTISSMIQALAASYGAQDGLFQSHLREYLSLASQYGIGIDPEYFAEKFGVSEPSQPDALIMLSRKVEKSQDEGLVDKIKAQVAMNYSNTIFGLDTVATLLGYSTQYLSTIFKKSIGMNFSSYLTAVRMEHAKKLLSTTNKKIKDIALECGYSYTNYFIRVFNKYEGVAPSEWKKR